VFAWFLWIWVVYSAGCALMFLWGLIRGWEIEILMPIAFFIIGSPAWWILYLVLDKIAQHLAVQVH
jgi:hypothetical protein